MNGRFVLGTKGPLAVREGPTNLLLAKVKNVSGRIGIITPHVSDVIGVIVLTSYTYMCVCVCPSVSLSGPNGRTNNRLDFWHGGQVDEYLGQVLRSRSMVKVTRSKKMFSMTFH